jgi:hypothetical protein
MAQECEKIELAGTQGFRVVYCRNCDVVELEVGAMSLRLSPEIAQRFANVMMKASLRLERVVNSSGLATTGTQTSNALH